MPATDGRLGQRSAMSWRSRAVVIAVLTISYSALYYRLSQPEGLQVPIESGPPMFTPVVSEIGETRHGIASAEPRRPGEPEQGWQQRQLTPPPRHWTFPPIELSPSAPGWAATVSDLTPVRDASPDPSEVEVSREPEQSSAGPDLRRTNLRMVAWFRPVYDTTQCAGPRDAGRLLLDLQISPDGRPAGIKVAQSSGSPFLDKTALHAAGMWRFAPPPWNGQPIEVSARIELRFNC